MLLGPITITHHNAVVDAATKSLGDDSLRRGRHREAPLTILRSGSGQFGVKRVRFCASAAAARAAGMRRVNLSKLPTSNVQTAIS
jgi:hypothetical protein